MHLPETLAPMAHKFRWCLWRYYTDDDGKQRKLPYDLDQVPGLGKDRTPKWGTLAQVLTVMLNAPNVWDGVGYVPAIDDPFACIDFDSLPHPLWQGLLDTTYCERSPSNVENKGHAIIELDAGIKARLKGNRNIEGFELYSDSGFFTVTGLALNTMPIAHYGTRMWNLADRLGLQPKSPTMPILTTGRAVTRLEVGRIWQKIERWNTVGPRAVMLRDDWAGVQASTWAPRSKAHPTRIDRSQCMIDFVKWLLHAGARDPDLLMTLISESAVWRDGYSKREDAVGGLIGSVIPLALAKYPPPPPSDGKPVMPSHLKNTPK